MRRRTQVPVRGVEDAHESGPDPALLDDLERDLAVSVDASSEDERLVRLGNSRHVCPKNGRTNAR